MAFKPPNHTQQENSSYGIQHQEQFRNTLIDTSSYLQQGNPLLVAPRHEHSSYMQQAIPSFDALHQEQMGFTPFDPSTFLITGLDMSREQQPSVSCEPSHYL